MLLPPCLLQAAASASASASSLPASSSASPASTCARASATASVMASVLALGKVCAKSATAASLSTCSAVVASGAPPNTSLCAAIRVNRAALCVTPTCTQQCHATPCYARSTQPHSNTATQAPTHADMQVHRHRHRHRHRQTATHTDTQPQRRDGAASAGQPLTLRARTTPVRHQGHRPR